MFEYSLNPGGVLVLGTSETIERSDLFSSVDEYRGIFRRREHGVRQPPPTVRSTVRRPNTERDATTPAPEVGYVQLHRSLLEQHGPPSLLVDANNSVVRFSSRVGQFLDHPPGAPTNDVFQMVDERLRLEVRSAIYSARHDGRTATARSSAIVTAGSERRVLVRAFPVEEDDLVLVVFEVSDAAPADATIDDATTSAGLSAELDDANRRLKSVLEQYATGQERMRSANEELQSTNEELRSTMEELETSKEELQSTNEELSTLNQENRHKVEELAMLSSDLQNLLVATDIATLFLDRQLRIVRFTPPITDIFNIEHEDRGRHLTDFTNRLDGHQLAEDAQQVLDQLVPIEYEIHTDDARWLLTRITPYRTPDDRIEGIVVTFVDITRRYEAEAALRTSEHGLRQALDAAAMGTWWWNPATGESAADGRAYGIVGATSDDGPFVDIVSDRLVDDDRQRWLSFVSSGDGRDVEFQVLTGDGTGIHIQVSAGLDAAEIDDRTSEMALRRGTIRDVTTRVRATEEAAERTTRLTLLAQAAAHLLRGRAPETVLDQLFGDMSAVLGLEIFERFDLDSGAVRRLGGNAGWMPRRDGEAPGDDIGEHLCELASDRGDPVIVDDVEGFPEAIRPAAERDGLRAYGCFPLLAGAEVLGFLCFGTRGTASFDDPAVELIRTIVDYLAAAAQRLRTESELRELNQSLSSRVEDATRDLRTSEQQLRRLASDLVRAEQSERERVAQLLHDDLQQLLFGAQMRMGLLRDDIDAAGEEVTAHLDEAERYLAESIAIARHLTAELAPPTRDDDLADIVRWQVEQMAELHGLQVEVDLGDGLEVADRPTRIIVHQTIRELLFNVVKHAGIDRARVAVDLRGDQLDIHVADGGSGFDTDDIFTDPARDGRGLATLRQRLSLVGGDLQIRSIPGDGTSARVWIPTSAPATDSPDTLPSGAVGDDD